MKIKLVFFTLLFFIIGKSQNLYNLNLNELFDLGIANSTKLKSSQIKSNIAVEKAALAKIERLPVIGVSAVNGYVGKPYVYDKDFSFVSNPKMPHWKQNYSLELNQPIYQGGKIKNSIKYASLEKEIASMNFEKDKSDIKLVLIKNYLELFRLYKQKQVFEKNIIEAQKRLHNIKNLKEEGIVTNNDVLRSQIVVSEYELSLKETTDDIIILSKQLDIVLGLDENTIIMPDTTILEKKILVEPEEYYVQQGYEKYPELKISAFNIEKARVDKKIIKSKYLPSLSLNAGNTLLRPITTTSPVQDLYLNSWTVTIGLSYKISSWFDHKHTINQAKYNIDLQEKTKEQIEQNIRMNVKFAYIKYKEAVDRVYVLTQTVDQSKDNYRITNNKYFNQLSILTDLLDASSVQLNAELQLTLAQANSIYNYYLLLNASGNL